jgi:hypothetical protein
MDEKKNPKYKLDNLFILGKKTSLIDRKSKNNNKRALVQIEKRILNQLEK